MKLKAIIIFILCIVLTGISLYFDPFHKPVENIDALIRKNYSYARDKYYGSNPDASYSFNINDPGYEIDNISASAKAIIIDSMVTRHTWHFHNHSESIWVARTMKDSFEIVDALRYKNSVRF